MKRATLLLLSAAMCFLVTSPAWAIPSICDAVPGNLVTNCGFETGDFTGWTQTGDSSFTGVDGNPNSGNNSAFLGSVFGNDFLTQNVGDNSTLYHISFYLANDGGTPNNFTALWNGIDIGPSLVDAPGFPYTQYSGYFPGNSGAGSNSLTFVSFQLSAFYFLDDVVVTNTPEPASFILFGSGILGLAGVIRRKVSL